MPVTSNARIGRLNPRRSSSPTGSPTASPSVAENTRCATRTCHGPAAAAQARRQVRDAADRRVVEAPLEADAAERGESLRDADPEAEVVAAPAPAVGELGDPVAHRHGHRDGPLGGVVDGQRVVEEHHEPVAGEALERALEPVDELAERGVVLREHPHDLFGLARLGERRESAQVAEDHHDLAAMTGEEALVARVDDQVHQLRRQEPAQAVHPLQLVDLGVHARLQLGVPLPRVRRTAARSCPGIASPVRARRPGRAARPD